MGTPIVIATNGYGRPVVLTTNGTGMACTIATNGFGMPVVISTNGFGMPVTGFSVGPDTTAPIITSSNAVSVPENQVLTHYLLANEAVTWAKAGGADQAAFTLASGVLTLPAQDFEAGANTKVVQVQATDAASNVSAVQTITVTITDVDEGVTAAPTLALAASSDTGTAGDNITADTTPDIDVTPGTPILVGDVITLEVDDNSGFTSPVTIINTIDSAEALAGSITETIPALTTGTWYYRAKHARGAVVSAWSTTLAIQITGGAAPAAAWVPNATALANNEAFGSSTSTFNLTLTSAATDTVMVAVSHNAREVGGVTIGGAAMTRAVLSNAGADATSIWYKVGAYTNPTVVVTSVGATFQHVAISYGKWTGTSAVPDLTTAVLPDGFRADPAVLAALTIPAGGMLLASSKGSNPITWNNATEDAEIVGGTAVHSSAHSVVAGSLAVSSSGNSFAGNAMAAITIGPTFVPDTTAPVLSSPTGTKTGTTTATLTVSSNEASGTWYGSASTAVPSKAQIKAGQTSTGAASSYAFNQAVAATGVQTKNAIGLTASTSYTMHYMQEDTSGNQSNIASAASFTTDAASGGTLSDITWVSSFTDDGTPAPGIEHTGLAFGPATADRVLVVFVTALGAAGSDNMLWGVKINDVTATQGNRTRVGALGLGVHYLNVPTGTTGKVEIDGYSNGWMTRYAVVIGYMTGSATASVHSLAPTGPQYPNGNVATAVTVPTGGVAALVAYAATDPALVITWTNATKIDDEPVGGASGFNCSAAFTKTSATVTLGVTPTGQPWGWSGVIFQP